MVAVALGFTERLRVMTESQALVAGTIRKYVPALSKLSEPKGKVWPWQMDAEMVAVALGFTERLRVMTESQALAAGTIRKYVPALSKLSEPKGKVWPWQMDAEMVAVALGFTERLRVMTESQALAAGTIRKYVPALSKLSEPKGKLWPWQIA